MENGYTIAEMRYDQEQIRRTAELQNIQRLQKNVDDAMKELREAQLQRQNRIMSQGA